MERVYPSLFCIANIYDVAVQISRQCEILRFRIEYDDFRPVCPFIEKQTLQEKRLTTTGLSDYHSVAVLIQISSLPQVENERIMIALVLTKHNAALIHNKRPNEREYCRKRTAVDTSLVVGQVGRGRNICRLKTLNLQPV